MWKTMQGPISAVRAGLAALFTHHRNFSNTRACAAHIPTAKTRTLLKVMKILLNYHRQCKNKTIQEFLILTVLNLLLLLLLFSAWLSCNLVKSTSCLITSSTFPRLCSTCGMQVTLWSLLSGFCFLVLWPMCGQVLFLCGPFHCSWSWRSHVLWRDVCCMSGKQKWSIARILHRRG